MKSNYDVLEKYIQQVDVRNRDLSVELLLGVSINKKFIPSIANTVGTDFSSYKIVKRNQFSYGTVTSRNGDKVSIALCNVDECIISSSYSVFEIIDTGILLPEYLMLWFKRPEFDRYARFKSHGSVREVFDWDELCKVELPVPDISVQRSIVKAYNTVEDRIRLLRKINDNLEAMSDSLFSEYFFGKDTDFITEPLDCNIQFVNGLAMQNFRPEKNELFLPVIKIRELNLGYCDSSSEYCTKNIDQSRIINRGDLVFSWSGSLTIDYWHDGTAGLNQHLFKVTSKIYPLWFCYLWVKYHLLNFQRIAENKGTTFGHIKREDLSSAEILCLSDDQLAKLDNCFSPIFQQKLNNGIESLELAKLQNFLLLNLSSGK